ncbi:MAG: hypothetical protein FE834_08670, partial [Gammaproteobacteria bacterium]|nr:hypothetical protein [Gammaproteobacteria bacterium]
ANIKDTAGNTVNGTTASISATGASFVAIDTSAPTAPSITHIADNVGDITDNIPNNGKTDDTTPTVWVSLTGTEADVGSKVELYDGITKIGTKTLTAQDITNNAVDIDTNLTNGNTYVIKAKVIDKAGNPSGFSATHTITIDTSAPTAPSITHIADNVGDITDNIPNNGKTDDTTPTVWVSLTGIGADVGSKVELYDGIAKIGTKTLTAQDITNNAVGIDTHLTIDRTYVIKAKVIDKAGNPSGFSATHTITIDTSAPTAPSITRIEDDVDPITGNIANNGKTNDTTPTVQVNLTGTGADAGSTVELYDDTTKIGTATLTARHITNNSVDIVTDLLTNGKTYDIKAKVIDKAGNVGAWSDTYEITIDTEAPTKPDIVRIIDNIGAITTDTPNGGSTDDNEPTVRVNIAGTGAEIGDKVRLYNGLSADEDKRILAKASTTLEQTHLDQGYIDITTRTLADNTAGKKYDISARIIDKAGNLSSPSAEHSIIIDTSAPTIEVSRVDSDTVILGGRAEITFQFTEE